MDRSEEPVAVARTWLGDAIPALGFLAGARHAIATGAPVAWWQIAVVAVGWLVLTGGALSTVRLYPDHVTFGFGFLGLFFHRQIPLSHVSVIQRRSDLEFCSRERILLWRACVTLPGRFLQPPARRRAFVDRLRESSVLVLQDS
jgi:hypothetical protein